LGPDWQDCFETIICNSRKPLFQKTRFDFYEFNKQALNMRGEKLCGQAEMRDYSTYSTKNKIFLEGNAETLTEYL
jgi:hypothetical protein